MRRRSLKSDADREQTDSAAVWMISFSDLLTVLLAMFVMRFSMSRFDPATLQKVLPGKTETAADSRRVAESELLGGLRALVSEPALSTSGQIVGEQLEVQEIPGGALLSLGADTFKPGSRELSPDMIEKVRLIGDRLRAESAQIEIAGHSDDVPISTPLYPSNWELSSARAIEVAGILMQSGIPGGRISAVGYADTKPRADNATMEGRQRNRRVEIFVRLDTVVEAQRVEPRLQ